MGSEDLAEGHGKLALSNTVNNTDLSTQMTIGGVVCLSVKRKRQMTKAAQNARSYEPRCLCTALVWSGESSRVVASAVLERFELLSLVICFLK